MSAVFGLELITAYLLLMGLLTLFVAVLAWQRHRTQRTISVWLASGVVGILLGSMGTFAAMRLAGNTIAKVRWPCRLRARRHGTGRDVRRKDLACPGWAAWAEAWMGDGRRHGPAAKRELVTAVRKLDLLTGEIAITLAPNQAAAILESLKDIDQAEELSDDDAKAKHEQILAALDETQKARLDAIGLPRARARADRAGRRTGRRGQRAGHEQWWSGRRPADPARQSVSAGDRG